MSGILDMITGGGLLPYVYCSKITLENTPDQVGKTDITLNLELYQSVKEIHKSSWLNSLGTQGLPFLDAMFIQVLPIYGSDNVQRLLPATNPLSTPGNIYVAKQSLGDGYLPRGQVGEFSAKDGVGVTATSGKLFNLDGHEPLPAPIQVSVSSLIGNLSSKDILVDAANQGKVREEVVKGKAYYVVPFEYKLTGYSYEDKGSLGFAFYTFLHVPYFVSLVQDPTLEAIDDVVDFELPKLLQLIAQVRVEHLLVGCQHAGGSACGFRTSAGAPVFVGR